MKLSGIKPYIILLLLVTALSLSGRHSQAQTVPFTKGMSIKAGGGLTSFFGDLAAPGLSSLGYTKAGFTGSVIKMFNPVFGLQAQYLGANIYSKRTDISQYFNGFVNEISLAARLELLPMFAPSSQSRINPYLKAGLATTRFRTVRRDIDTNTVYLPAYGYQNDGLTKTASQNALSIPIAVGIGLRITDNFFLEAEQAISLTNTDVLDAFVVNGGSNDIFGLTQIGLKFTIDPIRSSSSTGFVSPKQSRNKYKNSRGDRDRNDSEEIGLTETNILVQSVIPEKPVSGKIFEVKLTLNKEDYKGKAILTQSFPRGFTAMESGMSDAIFSFVDQKVRIIWEEMPADHAVEYNYLVRPSETARGRYTINGSLEYEQPGAPRVVHFANYIEVANQIESNMDNRILGILGEDDDQNEKQTKSIEKDDNNLDLKIEDLLRRYGGDTKEQENKEEAVQENRQQQDIKQNKAISGTEFRIQIGAFRDREQGRSIVRRYNLPQTVTEEFVNGLYKYTLGSFKSYNSAVKFRDQFIKETQIWGAFVVAYQNGVRVINIQDLIK